MINKILTAAAFGIATMGAQASTNLLADGNFESTGLAFTPNSSYCYVPDTGGAARQCGVVSSGWNAPIYLASNSGPWGTPSDQSHSDDLGNVVAAIQGASTISTTDFSFVVGQEYVISWDTTGRSNNGGVQPYVVTAGGVTFNTVNVGPSGWQSYSYDFVAQSTSGIVFQGTVNADNTAFIDNVSVTAVPEPTSLLMMGVAALGLVGWRRRAQV